MVHFHQEWTVGFEQQSAVDTSSVCMFLNGDDNVCTFIHSGKKSPCHQLYDFSLWTCLSSPQLACSQVLFYVDDIHEIISTSTSTGVNQICDRGRLKSNNSKITFPISKSFSLRFCNSVSNRNCLYALLCFQPLSTDLAPSAQV